MSVRLPAFAAVLAVGIAATISFTYAAPITPGPCDLQGMQVRSAADKSINNEEVCAAYKFLLERNGTGTRGTQCYRSQTDRILKLNPGFAVGLYKALSEIEKLYGGRNIIQSGFRCDGSNGNHPKGCAADIIWASCKAKGGDGWRCSSDRFDAPEQRWIDANGKQAPYNIHLRLRYAPEGHHVEPVNTAGCATGATVGSGNAPSSGISDSIRNLFAAPPQQEQMCALSDGKQVPCSSIANLGSQQALPQQQQPGQLGQQPPALGSENTTAYAPGTCPPQFYCKNDTYYYRSSTCVDQVQKKCFAGCSKAGTTCAATSTSETSSAFDQIENIAEPTVEVGTPVSDKLFELTLSGEDAVTLGDNLSPTTTQATSSTPVLPLQVSEQTFVSGDLRNSPAEKYPPQELSAMQRVLVTMRDALLRVLAYLRPFGRSQQPQPPGAVEHMEHEYEY